MMATPVIERLMLIVALNVAAHGWAYRTSLVIAEMGDLPNYHQSQNWGADCLNGVLAGTVPHDVYE